MREQRIACKDKTMPNSLHVNIKLQNLIVYIKETRLEKYEHVKTFIVSFVVMFEHYTRLE